MLVGKIIEKPSSSSGNPPPPPRASTSSSAHAFPPVLHRSQRATSRFGSNAQKLGESSKPKSTASVPKLVLNQDDFETLPEGEKVRRMVDDENTQRVASMTAEEREEEVGELKARFGSGLEGLMRRRREKREGKQTDTAVQAPHAAVPSGGDDENTRRVAAISEEERKEELKELEERFGSATLDALRTRALKKQGSGPSQREESKTSPSQPPRKSHPASHTFLTT